MTGEQLDLEDALDAMSARLSGVMALYSRRLQAYRADPRPVDPGSSDSLGLDELRDEMLALAADYCEAVARCAALAAEQPARSSSDMGGCEA